MLRRRTNIIFDEETWKTLSDLAKREKTSMGELTRQAVRKVYIEDNIVKDRAKAAQAIKTIRGEMKGTFTAKEIKKMIDYGRKY